MYVWYCVLFIYDNDLYYLNIIYIMFMLGSFVYMYCIYIFKLFTIRGYNCSIWTLYLSKKILGLVKDVYFL